MAPPSKSHFTVNNQASPEGNWNGKYEDFKKLAGHLDIDTFRNSKNAYTDAQRLLMTTYDEITTQAYKVADLWQGKAAAEFQKNLRALYVSACNLADATGQTGYAIGYHADDLQTLKDNVDKMKPKDRSFMEGTGDVFFGGSWDPLGISDRETYTEQHQNEADDAVKKWINNDLTHNTTTYTFGELPKEVHVELPNPTPGSYEPTKTGGPGDPTKTGGGPGTPNLSSPNPHTPSTPDLTSPNPHVPSTDPPGTPNLDPPPTHPGDTGGADLAGLPGHGGGGGGGGGLTPGLGGGGGGGGLGGLGTPSLGGGGGGGIAGGPGALGRAGGMSGATAAEEAAAARAAAMGRTGGGMTGGMPMGMGGAGGGGQQEERERTTWLTEDEDVWGGDDDVAPPVIG